LAESRERNRLARELHDTLAHSLTGLSLQLQALETLLDHDPAAARAELAEAKTTVRSGIKEARRAIQSLRATPLQDLGLPEALRQLARRHSERMGIALTCDVAEVGALDPLTEQTIYRVAEAALSNVEQHAAATELSVRLKPSATGGGAPPAGNCTACDGAGSLTLEINDNGVGFDTSDVRADRYGLSGMAERSALIGATLRVESRPDSGTRVLLTVGG
jgi:signal transduction histidine kinase